MNEMLKGKVCNACNIRYEEKYNTCEKCGKPLNKYIPLLEFLNKYTIFDSEACSIDCYEFRGVFDQYVADNGYNYSLTARGARKVKYLQSKRFYWSLL